MKDVLQTIHEVSRVIIENITNPEKRLYFGYLISSTVLAYYVYYKTKPKKTFWNYIFNKKTWLNQSAKVDYLLLLFNSFVKVILIGPYLFFGLYIAFYTDDFLAKTFGYESIKLSVTQTLILYTISLTLLSDFTTYVLHYMMHRLKFLWEFHKIHHAATTLNPITQYRIHPIELILVNCKETIVFGLVMGFFDYLSVHQIEKITFLGINIFSFIFLFLGANLRHSSVKLKYFNFLEYFFLSPYQHQIHHSNLPEHFDQNLGSKLAIWDWMFGTLLCSNQVKKITFGISEEEDKQHKYTSFVNNLYLPFKNIYRELSNKVK